MRPLPSAMVGEENGGLQPHMQDSSGSNNSSQLRTAVARTLDVVAAGALLAGNAAIFYTAVTKMYKTHGIALAAAVCGGVFGR